MAQFQNSSTKLWYQRFQNLVPTLSKLSTKLRFLMRFSKINEYGSISKCFRNFSFHGGKKN